MAMTPFSAEEKAFNREIGALVKQWRLARGLTQEQLARRIGWTKSQVGNLETARAGVRLYQVSAVAKGLGLPLPVMLKQPAAAPIGEDGKVILPLARAFAQLPPRTRWLVSNLLRLLAGEELGDEIPGSEA